MPGPLGAPSIKIPDPAELIRQLQERMTNAEEAITALQSKLSDARPVAALGLSGVVPVPMPEAEIGPAVERIVAACVALGYEEERLRLFESDIHDALAWGVPEATIVAHYTALLNKKGGDFAALYFTGHGSTLRLDESLWPLLLDGRGIGFSVQLATDEDWMRIRGYTPAEEEAVANLPENKPKFIYDFLLFRASGGLSGWRPRANDPRGRSSDDDLFGGGKP